MKLPIHNSASSNGGHTTVPARVAPQRGCVGRHLLNRNKMRISGPDSYALLFLFRHRGVEYGECMRVGLLRIRDSEELINRRENTKNAVIHEHDGRLR